MREDEYLQNARLSVESVEPVEPVELVASHDTADSLHAPRILLLR